MDWKFWIPVISAVLDIYLVIDLLVTLVSGESIPMLIFGAGGNPLVGKIVEILPTDPTAFLLVCAIVLMVMIIICIVLIWASFWTYRSRKMLAVMH